MNKVVELVRHARDQVKEQDELGSIIRAGAVTLAIRVAAAGATYLSVVALARWMGASEFGVYTFAWAWTVLLAIFTGLGFPGANVRFIPTFVASDDWARIRGVVRTSWALTGGASLAIVAAGILTVLFLRQYIAPHHIVPLLIALAGIPFVSLVTLQSEMARGFGWMVAAYAPSLLAVPLLVMAIAFAVLQLAGSLRATTVTVATVTAYFLVLLYQASVLRHRLAPKIRDVAPCYERRLWLRVAMPFLLINGFMIVHFQSDVIMVGLFLDPQEVAFYNAAARTAFLTTFILQAGNALGAPKYALLYSQGRTGELQALLSSLIHWMFWPSFLVVLAMIVLGGSILGLFGPLFSAGYWPLVILALGQLISASVGPVPVLLNMTGHQAVCAKVLGCSALLNILLNALLIPRFGIVGAAIGTACAMMFWNAWLLVLVVRRLGVQPSLLPMSLLKGAKAVSRP